MSFIRTYDGGFVHIPEVTAPKFDIDVSKVRLAFNSGVPAIKKVIFNPPATIVFWEDNTKTVVKCMEGKEFNKWDGLAMAICKRYYGGNFKKVFRKWCGK